MEGNVIILKMQATYDGYQQPARWQNEPLYIAGRTHGLSRLALIKQH